MLALPQLTGCALVPATASRPRVRSHTQMVDSLPLLLSRRSAVTLLAAVLPICGPSCPVASAMESGIYGRNERVVIPILGDLMGLAGPGGVQLNRAEAQLGKLAESMGQLEQLAADLQLPEYKGTSEDSVAVLRLSAVYFKTTPAVMVLAAKIMSELTAAELEEVNTLTNAFKQSVQALEQGCRTNEVLTQLDAARRASGTLAQYLRVAANHYTVPNVGEAVRIPSDAVKRDALGQVAVDGGCRAADCEAVGRANKL